MSKVQAVLFNKEKFDSKTSLKWLKENNFKPIMRVHMTDKYRVYRIIEMDYENFEYKQKKSKKDIDFIMQMEKNIKEDDTHKISVLDAVDLKGVCCLPCICISSCEECAIDSDIQIAL